MENIQEESVDLKQLIQDMTAAAENDQTGVGSIAALLAMDDNEFEIMSPIIADQFKQQINNINDKTIFTTAMQMEGVKYEDLVMAVEEIEKMDAEELGITDVKKSFLIQIMTYLINAYGEIEGTSKRIIEIPVEFVGENIQFPNYSTLGAAGADVYAIEDVTINPGQTKIVKTGLKMEIPYGYAVLVQMRSGLAAKTKLRLANSLGLIDSDYRGEIGVILENTEPNIKDFKYDNNGNVIGILYGQSYTISKGDRIAQLRLVEVPRMKFVKIDSVNETDRGEGGYGSTGK